MTRVRFCGFELDLRSGDLLRPDGSGVILPDQPFRILAALVNARGELVTREDLCRELWPEHTFVDFEHSLNAGIKRLREAIGDSASSPRFIETVPTAGTDSSRP
jgi:cholera toxin transcriptional activator